MHTKLEPTESSPAGANVPEPGLIASLFGHLRVSIVATIVLAVVVCGIYPLIVWGLAQIAFPHKANGSLIGKDGQPVALEKDAVGSSLIGQSFADARYFHPRPSSAGNGYDATASSGSNLGPTSAKLFNGTTKKDDKGNEVVDFDGIELRLVHYCVDNGIDYNSSVPLDKFKDAQGNLDEVKLIKAFNDDKSPLIFAAKEPVPADAVTGSGSGLDPHISVDYAKVQAKRVANARGMTREKVLELVSQATGQPDLGIFGEPRVNVLTLNLALDRISPAAPATAPAIAPTTAPATAP
ncbi:MAG: K+-transporting ATPase, subunit [Phycisphaerales bacterium]|nr:K+-transporting ATPase, subunit [Phycisphaerales bacterium]MDB5354627.1 K+-transporting ATPase, subunit [Phycisphaerales bacterium]